VSIAIKSVGKEICSISMWMGEQSVLLKPRKHGLGVAYVSLPQLFGTASHHFLMDYSLGRKNNCYLLVTGSFEYQE